MEETQALVDGCNKWGVGNWKAILNDTQFQFQGRSPVDLKDRFRTYFPDAYRFHYPNAKTHLSSRVRSFLPDGTSIFEKTRSKKRRPFSAEEDEALRLGYEKHGTTWATIVKDPIFQSQERRSTDLRDRFRNAFPELYKAAGYKPRPRASTSAASRAAATSSTAGTSGAVTPSSTAKASTSTVSEHSKKGRGRGRAVSASTSQSGSVAHSASSSRRKRTSISAAGERPIGPGEPTAIDFYRPRSSHQHSSTSSASTPKVAPENIPIMDSEDEESSEYEYEEEEQYFPLTSIDASQLTSGVTSPAKIESHFTHANHHANGLGDSASDLHLKSEEDMDVDGDVMFHDDELDGTALSPGGGATSPSSPSDALHSAAGTSPVVSQTIQELLDNANAVAGLASATGALNHSFRDSHSFRAGGASADPFRNPRPQIQPHHSSASTTSLNTSAASEDWQSLSSSHNGNGLGNGNGMPSSSAWMSHPASPTPSDFFIPPSSSNAQMGRIGKSAWGPLDWLSNNPRLDQGMGLMGGNGALTSWPTPLSDQYAVLDRYDLYSTVEAAHDFASEADARHNHHSHHNHPSHTHSYPDESIFRGFTHHRYAGDLIPGSGVAVHPPSLHTVTGPTLLSFAGSGTALGLGLGGGLQDDYAASVTSGSHVSLAALGLQDIDELSVVNHTSAAPSGTASPMKRSNKEQQELALELEAMIVVDAEVPGIGPVDHHMQDALPTSGPGKIHQLSVPSASSSQQSQSMEEAGAITPTGLNPASLPCPPSPLRLDQARLPADSTQFRRPFPPPARPHSRSVSTQGQIPTPAAGGTTGAGLYHRPTTPSAWARDSSRSISQPPSEHRQALQRSLSYLDPMITTHVGLGGGGMGGLPQVLDDPLAYNEPLSISSLDLQYGMSSGPNIFTPLTMFSDPPSIAPLRTLNSTAGRNGVASAASAGSAQQQGGSTSTAATATGSVNVAPSAEEALDLSALIHTSPIPPHRNHQRHQSQSMVAPRELESPRDRDRKKRSSWDGGLFGMGLISATTQQSGGAAQDDATLFLDFK